MQWLYEQVENAMWCHVTQRVLDAWRVNEWVANRPIFMWPWRRLVMRLVTWDRLRGLHGALGDLFRTGSLSDLD